jgi:hypothetical protein
MDRQRREGDAMRPFRWVLIIPVVVIMTLLDVTEATAASRIEEGRPFPDLTLPALDDGRPLSVSDFRGRKVVLHVFASW